MSEVSAGRPCRAAPIAALRLLPYLENGAVKAFAIMAKSLWAGAPDVPTIDEAGVPELALSHWQAFWLPRGRRTISSQELNATAVAALSDASVRQRLDDLGQEIPPPEQQTPAALGAYHKAEIEKWWPIIKAAGIKAE